MRPRSRVKIPSETFISRPRRFCEDYFHRRRRRLRMGGFWEPEQNQKRHYQKHSNFYINLNKKKSDIFFMISLLEKKQWLSIVMTILIAIEIFYFSTLQGGTGTGGSNWIANTYHFAVFFLFAFFFFVSIKKRGKIKTIHVTITLIVSILYAISDEIHQSFVPFRDAGIKDILIDSLGICSAMIIGLIINRKTISQT